jgi:hypothetical protein
MNDHFRPVPKPAPPPAQTRFLDDIRDRHRIHLEDLRQRFVAAALGPALDGARVGVAEVLRQDDGLLRMRLMREAH